MTRCGLPSRVARWKFATISASSSLAPDERRLEAADDRFRVVQHASEDVVAASPLGGDCVTDEAPRSLADEDVRVAGGGAQSIRLLERRARDERPPEGAVARDDVAGGDACTSDEPAGDERERGANGAKRVVLARRGNAEDPENARVSRASAAASVGIEGCDRFLAAPAELVTPQLRVGAGVGGQVGEQDGDRLARLLDSSAGFRLHAVEGPASSASWRRIARCSSCSCAPGSAPSSSTSVARAAPYASSASACRPER